MFKRKHRLSVTILSLCLIGLIGFKDTGIFVKEYVSTKEDGTLTVFNIKEKIKVVRETDEFYIAEKEGIIYEIPMNVMIRTTRTSQSYIVKKEASLLDKPMGNPIKYLNINEIVQALRFEGNYGFFSTEDDTKGYIDLSNLDAIIEDNISYGISKVHKVIKENNEYYTLVKDEIVAIKDFKDNVYIIVDEKGNEFKVSEEQVELRKPKERVTRGSISRRGSAVTKVIEGAYNALGKPYVSGDTGKRGYDCSGLTYSIYLNLLGIKLNRSSKDQAKNGIEVKKEDLIPGDLVFFRTSGKSIGHVGIYIGDGDMIHASSGRKQVMISPLDETYYKTRYVTARRIINN